LADGPHVNGKAQGIQIGRYYIRVNGPKSDPIKTPDQWRPVIHRCIAKGRKLLIDNLLEGIRQQIGTPSDVQQEPVRRETTKSQAEPARRAKTHRKKEKGQGNRSPQFSLLEK
jgi:hypothetical protein